ncbi:MAG: YciI family protein [Rhodothermales bacterium]
MTDHHRPDPLDALMDIQPDASRMNEIRNELMTQTDTDARPNRERSRWMMAATVVLAVAVGFLGGRMTAPIGDAGPAAVRPAGEKFLITLHEDASFQAPPMQEAVAEYNAWGGALAERGQFVTAEKLVDEPPAVLPAVDAASGPVMTGFYIIRAGSRAEAVSIAETMPHLKYGGTVQVHPVEDISKYIDP